MKIVVASNNVGKVQEIKALLLDLPVEWIDQRQLNIASIEETGRCFVDNALLKARHAARLSGLPALADDSGLCIDALGGAPGVHSARYAGNEATDADRIDKVLGQLKAVAEPQRTAQFRCVIVLVRRANDEAPLVAEGVWPGVILTEPRGQHGFGYDPIFYLPEWQSSAAELSADVKNRISHRGRAMTKLRQQLDKFFSDAVDCC